MRTIHRRKHGKRMLKRTTRLNPPFTRDSNVQLMKLTMILLHARDNAHGKQVIRAKPVKIGPEVTKNGQDAGLSRIERGRHNRGMMRMDDRGMANALIVRITTTQANHTGSDLARRAIFTNALILTMNSMRGITSSTTYPGELARMQRRA